MPCVSLGEPLNVATCWQTVRPPTSVNWRLSEHARSVHAVEWLQLRRLHLVSERVVQEDRFTTIHIQELRVCPVTPSWGQKRSPLTSRTG